MGMSTGNATTKNAKHEIQSRMIEQLPTRVGEELLQTHLFLCMTPPDPIATLMS
jgi:hypothetical protein